MAKFTIYRCDTCNRENEILLNAKGPDPLRCNITLKCRGRLQRLGDRSAKKFLFTPIVSGLDDYIQRGLNVLAPNALETVNKVPIFTGGSNGMIAAIVIRRRVVGSQSQFYVISGLNDEIILETGTLTQFLPLSSKITLQLFEITPEILKYNKYLYTFANEVQLISGPDNSPQRKNLRFSTLNKIKVYVNGIELATNQFDITVDNQITLTPIVTGTNNIVEVFVYNDINTLLTVSDLIPLELRPLLPTVPFDLSLRALNCWGNFRTASVDGVERIICFGYDFALIDQDKSYAVAKIEASSLAVTNPVTVKPSEFQILLGKEPFAIQDKELHLYLSGNQLVNSNLVLSYSKSTGTGKLELSIDEKELTEVFNPIKSSGRITVASNANLQSSSNTLGELAVLKTKYIIGPS